MRQLVYLFPFFLLIQSALSQPKPSTVQADYEALLTAERSFARMAVEKGIKEAFVDNMVVQIVVFLSDRFTPGMPFTGSTTLNTISSIMVKVSLAKP